jgi:hypothetical protein
MPPARAKGCESYFAVTFSLMNRLNQSELANLYNIVVFIASKRFSFF